VLWGAAVGGHTGGEGKKGENEPCKKNPKKKKRY